MCNWQYFVPGLSPVALVRAAVTGDPTLGKEKKKQDEAMARSQALQDALNKKTQDLSTALDNETPVNTSDRVLTSTNKKKNTIKSLNIPLNTDSSGTGLNI